MFSARVTRGVEVALFLGLVSPLLVEWFETVSASSRLSYALLVPALALVLAVRAAPARLSGAAAAAPSKGTVAAALAAFLPALFALSAALALLAGSLSSVFTLSLLAVPLAALAFTARLVGPAGVRRFAPALMLLFLMVPPPMPVMDRVNPFLIQASGSAAVTLLTPFDPEVGWAGSNLLFRGWTLIVAEACSGSGTFLMLGVLCAFLAGLFRMRPLTAGALLLVALPLTLLVNGVRIASSALIIARFGAAAGEGLAHELLGQAVVITGAALLVLAVERWTARGAEARA
ncbi:MAG: exosortase/archaeosortase family protein [Planctomycetes bacterium]|nr:exosortase/archaeosortase family protein [Planctomycetota bacterium]